jgi:hypothetical protein
LFGAGRGAGSAAGFAAFSAGFASFFGCEFVSGAFFVSSAAAFAGDASLLFGIHRRKPPFAGAHVETPFKKAPIEKGGGISSKAAAIVNRKRKRN